MSLENKTVDAISYYFKVLKKNFPRFHDFGNGDEELDVKQRAKLNGNLGETASNFDHQWFSTLSGLTVYMRYFPWKPTA